MNKNLTIQKPADVKSLIQKGSNFEFLIPANKAFSLYLKQAGKSDKNLINGIIFDTNDRIAAVRIYPEMAQTMAYAVYRKYQVGLRAERDHFLLRFLLK